MNYNILKDNNYNNIDPDLWCKFDNNGLTVNSGKDNTINLINNNVTYANTMVKGDNSASFNNINTYLSGSIKDMSSISFSISCWIYPKDNFNNDIMTFGTNNARDSRIFIGYGINIVSKYSFGFYSNDINSIDSFPNDINTWVHLTYIYNKDLRQRIIYRNGVKLNLEQNNLNTSLNITNTFYIGSIEPLGAGYYFNGYIDDLRVYKGIILTQEQVLQLYNPVSYTEREDTQIDPYATTISNMELIQYPSTFPNNDSIGAITTERNKDGTIYYVQTYRINNSLYTIKFSSYNENYKNASPLYLFDKNTNNSLSLTNNGGCFADMRDTRYDISTGNYLGNKKYKDILGEWVSITFPEQFILKQYGFIAKKGLENCAPGKWSVYADNEKPQLIDTNNIRLSYVDYYKSSSQSTYIKQLQTNNIKTNTYTFVFQAAAQSDRNVDQGTSINFIEILLFGTPS